MGDDTALFRPPCLRPAEEGEVLRGSVGPCPGRGFLGSVSLEACCGAASHRISGLLGTGSAGLLTDGGRRGRTAGLLAEDGAGGEGVGLGIEASSLSAQASPGALPGRGELTALLGAAGEGGRVGWFPDAHATERRPARRDPPARARRTTSPPCPRSGRSSRSPRCRGPCTRPACSPRRRPGSGPSRGRAGRHRCPCPPRP